MPHSIVEQALKLPPAERGQIIRELLASLDEDGAEPTLGVDQAWADELKQRAHDARQEVGVDLHAVCDELEANRRGRAK